MRQDNPGQRRAGRIIKIWNGDIARIPSVLSSGHLADVAHFGIHATFFFDLEDINHIQPVSEFVVLHQHDHEFASNPVENPACPPKLRRRRVILSDFPASATEKLFSKN